MGFIIFVGINNENNSEIKAIKKIGNDSKNTKLMSLADKPPLTRRDKNG
ncbi:hypothetical protein GCM10027050_15010 [Psychrosphaera aestuarii]